MTMMSVRVDDDMAADVRAWADQLGIDRSELIRDALRKHLVLLGAQQDIAAWKALPATEAEASLGEIADWGLAEEWTDWDDATR